MLTFYGSVHAQQELRVPLLVDANSMYARSYYAAAKDTTQPPHLAAAQIMLHTTLTLVNPISGRLPKTPTHLLFAWDGKPKTDKGRGEKPQDYQDGKILTDQCLKAVFGAATCFPEFEADDAIATAAYRLYQDPQITDIYAASGDKDLQQLANDKVSYYSLNDRAIMPWSMICSKWNVKHPSQVAVALAILGDASDHIEGVKKWGHKKVAKLFQQVTEDMPLDQVAELVSATMSDEQLAKFAESLQLTLLDREIKDLVPDPAPIVIGGVELLETYGWSNLARQISMLAADRAAGQVNVDLID